MAASIDDLLLEMQRLNATMGRGGPGGPGGGAGGIDFDNIQTSGNKLADRLIEFGERSEKGSKLFGVGLSTFNTKLGDGARLFNKTIKESGSAFAADLMEGRRSAQEVTAEFEKTRKAIIDNNDLSDESKELYIQQVKAMENWVQQEAVVQSKQKNMAENADKIKKIFEALDATAGKLVKSYQGSSDGLSTATNMAQAGIGLAATGAEKAGGIMQKVAPALSMLGPYGMAAGAALSVLGTIVGAAGAAMREIAEKAMPIMNTQINAMSKSYMDAASTGALFGNGMSEMIKTSADAGLSMGTFSNIIKNNAGDLAKSGLGIAEGAKQVAGVGKIMRDSGTTEQLLKFGVSLEEQGGLVAQTVAKMRAGGGGAVDQSKVAEYTAKYAKDLKTLGDLTGEDVKSKEKQAQEAANNLAFQQELAGMAPEQRAKIQDAMKNMTALEQKAFMERMINNGELMSEDTNMMASQSKAFSDKTSQMFKDAQSGVLDLGRQTELNTQYGDAMKQDMLAMKDVAKAAFAGVEGVGNLAKNAMEQLTQSLTQTPEALQKALEARQQLEKKASEGGDPLTEKFGQITLKGEELRAQLDQLVGNGKAMDLYLTAVNSSTGAMLDMVKRFTGVETSGDRQARTEREAREKAANDKIGDAARKGETLSNKGTGFFGMGASERQKETSRISQMTPEQLESAAKQQGVSPDEFLKTLGIQGGMAEFTRRQEQQQRMIEQMQNTPMASGGLAMGSEEGFPAMLHGAEAVLPLDNPTTMAKIKDALFGGGANSVMNPESEEAMMATQSAAFADKTSQMFKDAMQQITASTSSTDATTALQEKMTQVMERGFADMVKVMSDIAYHTENTSVRVA